VGAALDALVCELGGEPERAAELFAAAAARWREFSMPYEEAFALLGRGRCLAAAGRRADAQEHLSAARGVFTRLGAKPALEETDALLAG
jgi:hypothetical protein